jgi:hypothetical protein
MLVKLVDALPAEELTAGQQNYIAAGDRAAKHAE